MLRLVGLVALLVLAGCAAGSAADDDEAREGAAYEWVYQLDGYGHGGLDEVAATHAEYAVVDFTRDGTEAFTAAEVGEVQAGGTTVLAYLSIGTIENYRSDAGAAAGLQLNRWEDWPDEHFVRYWDDAWWTILTARLDAVIEAGFDGVYLDTPLAYEEIDLALVPGETRESLAERMVALIVAISDYTKQRAPDFVVFPQNSPELREYPGYLDAVDGIGMEELFVRATDEPCDESWCAENLAHVRALRDAGKVVLAVDYADDADQIATACAAYAEEGMRGYVAGVDLDDVRPPCPAVAAELER